MNRLVIIGNGFDLAHGLKTSYMDFINWYWEQRVLSFSGNSGSVSKDELCEIHIVNTKHFSSWYLYSYSNSYFKTIDGHLRCPAKDIIDELRKDEQNFKFVYSPFFALIMKSIENKGWVDIENAYYYQLKLLAGKFNFEQKIKDLNVQLSYLKDLLIKYLGTQCCANRKIAYLPLMTDKIKLKDISTSDAKKVCDDLGIITVSENEVINENSVVLEGLEPKQIMLLNFNYTDTVELYNNEKIIYNYIHGNLSNPNNIIFGYGDELDKDFKDIEDKNSNELLNNVKSVKYLETSRYREMLEFVESAPFQVYIMGHSCGNSDRTLLNTIFEHENCVSIKPFYHIRENKTDNFLELVQNISRNFTDKKLFRARVVNKEQCEII